MSELNKSFNIKVKGDAQDLLKQLSQVIELNNDIEAKSKHEISIKFNPNQPTALLNEIKSLLKDPSVLRIDTAVAERDLKELEKRINSLPKTEFGKNGIIGSHTGKGATAAQTEEFKKLTSEIKLTEKELQKIDNLNNKKYAGGKKEELELEQKLINLYKQEATEVNKITSKKGWKKNQEDIERVTSLLQDMYDIKTRFNTNKNKGVDKQDKNLLGLDLDTAFDKFDEYKKRYDSFVDNITGDARELKKQIEANKLNNEDVDTLVTYLEAFVNKTSIGGTGTGASAGGTSSTIEKAKEDVQELGEESENTAQKIKELLTVLEANSQNDPLDTYEIEKTDEIIRVYKEKFGIIKELKDKIGDQKKATGELNENEINAGAEALKNLRNEVVAYKKELQKTENSSLYSSSADDIRRLITQIDNVTGVFNGLKRQAKETAGAIKEVSEAANSSPVGTNNYAKGANRLPEGFKKPVIATKSSNASDSNTSIGSEKSNVTVGNITVPSEIPTKVVMDISDAESKLNTLKEKVETTKTEISKNIIKVPVETDTNSIKNIKEELSSLDAEKGNTIPVNIKAENVDILDTLYDKLKQLKDSSNIEIKIDSKDLATTKPKIDVNSSSANSIKAKINKTLKVVEPQLRKLQVHFKEPVKKEIKEPVNKIIKEVSEKSKNISVGLKFNKTNDSKVDELTKKLLDVAEAIDTISERSRIAGKEIVDFTVRSRSQLKDTRDIIKEIATALKEIKGLNLGIKNVTYKQGDKTVKTDNESLEKERKEADNTTASLKRAIKAKEELLNKSQKKNADNNNSYYTAVVEQQTALKEAVEATKKAFEDKEPVETQKQLSEKLSEQADKLKEAEERYNAQAKLIKQIEIYKSKGQFKSAEDIIADNNSATLVKDTIEEQVSALDKLEKELKEASVDWDSLSKKEQQFASIQEKIKKYAQLDKKSFTYNGSLQNVQSQIEDRYKNRKGWSGVHVENSSTKGEKKLVYSYQEETGALKTLSATYREASQSAFEYVKSEKEIVTWGDKLTKSIKGKTREFIAYMSTFASFYAIFNTIRQGLTIMKQMDDAMTELKKVSNDSAVAVESFRQKSFELGNEIGATGTTITQAAADWSRLGYNIKEVQELSKASSLYVNVGDGIDATTATEDLVSTMKAFHMEAEDTIDIVDKLNEVGNNFAISSAEIGSGLKRSSSALETANNDLDQSIAMLTSMNEIIQDPETAGNTLKILSLRLRGASADIKAMHEEEDGLVTSTASLQALIQKLTSVNGKNGVNILQPDNKTFKSTYQIMQEISQIWDKMNDTSKSALLQAIAGKSRANGVAALLSNFETAEKALKSSQEASGSALKENERYLDSVSGKLSLLSNQWQEMWVSAVDSNAAKFFLDFANTLMKVVNSAGLLGTSLAAITATLVTLKGFTFADFTSGLSGLFTSLITSLKDNGFKGTFDAISKSVGSFFKGIDKSKIDVINELTNAFAGKNLTQIQEYVIQQNHLTKAFKNQFVACEDEAAAYGILEAEKLSNNAITKEEIILEGTVKALRAAVVAGVVLAIAAFVKYRQERHRVAEESKQALISESKEQTERLESIQKAYNNYKSLENEQGRVITSEEKLKEATTAVTDALGDKASELDGLTEGTKAYGKQLDEIYAKELRNATDKANTAYDALAGTDEAKDAKKEWSKQSGNLLAFGTNGINKYKDTFKQLGITAQEGYGITSFDKSIDSLDELYDKYLKACQAENDFTNQIKDLSKELESLTGKSDNASKLRATEIENEISELEYYKGILSSLRGTWADITSKYQETRKAQFSAFANNIEQQNDGQYKSVFDLSKVSGLQQAMEAFSSQEGVTLDVTKELAASAFPDLYSELEKTTNVLDLLREKTENESITLEQLENDLSDSEISLLTNPDFDVSSIDFSAQSWKKLAENIHEATEAYNKAQVAQMSFSDALTQQESGIDDIQKHIASLSEMYGKALSPEKLSATETIDLLQEMNKEFGTLQGVDFDINGIQDLDKLDDLIRKVIDDGGWLDKRLEEIGLDIHSGMGKVIKEAAQEEIKYKNAIQSATQGMSGLSSAYQTIRGAMDEYNKSGQMTFSTVCSILQLEPEYLSLLQMENGQLGINQTALEAMVEAKKADAIAATYEAEAAEISALSEQNAANMADASSTSHNNAVSALNAAANAYSGLANEAVRAARAEALAAGVKAGDIQAVDDKYANIRKNIASISVSSQKSADKALGYAKKAGGGAQKTAKEALDKILSALKEAVEDGAITTKDYLDQMKRLTDQYYAQGKISLQEYMEYQRQYYRGVVDMYKEVAAAVQRYFDKQKEGLNDQKEAIQDQIDALQEQQEAQDRVYDKQIKALEKEKKAIEKKKDVVERAYNKEIEAIEKKQHKIELQIRTYEHEKEVIEELQKAIERQVDELEDKQKIYQQMQKDIERQKRPYEDQKELIEKQIKALQRQQKEIEKQKKAYEEQIKLLEKTKRQLERQTTELERQKKPLENQKKYYEQQIKDLQKQEKVFEKQIKVIQKQQKELDKQRKLLEDSKKPYQDQLDILNEQKEALEKANQARQDAINLQKAQYALEQAHEQRTNLILKNGQFVYESDSSAVRDAENGLRDAQYQHKMKGIDDQIDANNQQIKRIDKLIKPITDKSEELQKSIDNIQESLDGLKEQEEAWKERSEEVQQSIDNINLKIDEIKDRITLLDEQIEDINYNYIQPLEDENQKLANSIDELNYAIEDIETELEKFEDKIKSLDRNIDELDAQIEKLNAENERYNELLEPIEDNLDKLKKKNDAYGESLDDLKYRLEQITKKYDKQIDKIDRKIDKINEEKDAFDEAIEDQIYELQKQEKAIDKQITAIDRYARQWQRVIDEWQLAKDQKLLEGVFGGNWKERLDSLDPSILQEFATKFRQACEDMRRSAEENLPKAIDFMQQANNASGGGGGGGTSPTGGSNRNVQMLNTSAPRHSIDAYTDKGDGTDLSSPLEKKRNEIKSFSNEVKKVSKEVAETDKTVTKTTSWWSKLGKEIGDRLPKLGSLFKNTSKDSQAATTNMIGNSKLMVATADSSSIAVKAGLSIVDKLLSATQSNVSKSSSDMVNTSNNVKSAIANSTKDMMANTNQAQSDTQNKSSSISNTWTGVTGVVARNMLAVVASNSQADKSTETSTNAISKATLKAEADTKSSMNRVSNEVSKGVNDAARQGENIKRSGSSAENDTKRHTSSINTSFNSAQSNSTSKASAIKQAGVNAQSATEQHTSKISQLWSDLKEKISGIVDKMKEWLNNLIEGLSQAGTKADETGGKANQSTTVQTHSHGGRVRIPVAAKGKRIRLDGDVTANLNSIANAVGEDVMVAAKAGEGIFTERQTDDLEELIELTPELISSTKEYARFANLFKGLTVNPMSVQENIAKNINSASKGANGNIVNSHTEKSISMQIGDVIVQGVQNVNDFAAKIKSNLPNAMLQELMSTT